MIIMSVDLGDARTGIAVCDSGENIATPNCVIKEYVPSRLYPKIAQKAKELCAQLIVVGNPKNMDGTSGERSQKAQAAAGEIETLSGIKTVLYDERCTTVIAHKELSAGGVYGKKRKDTVDALAAVLILEDYIKYKNNTNK